MCSLSRRKTSVTTGHWGRDCLFLQHSWAQADRATGYGHRAIRAMSPLGWVGAVKAFLYVKY